MKLRTFRRLDLDTVKAWSPEQWLHLFGETPQRTAKIEEGVWGVQLKKMTYGYRLYITCEADAVLFRLQHLRSKGDECLINVYRGFTRYVAPRLPKMEVHAEFADIYFTGRNAETQAYWLAHHAMSRHHQPVLVTQGSPARLHTTKTFALEDFRTGERYWDPKDFVKHHYAKMGIAFMSVDGRIEFL